MLRKRYYLSFIVKKHNTGNMKEWCIVRCKSSELGNFINDVITKLKEEYQDVYSDGVTKL